jgi:hypothetical protein
MVVCLIVVYEYEDSLIIKIDGNLVITVTFDVKLIFPLRITSTPNRFLSTSDGCPHLSPPPVVA